MIPAKTQKPIFATTTAPPLELVTRPREQQREFVSFLTWPFVLAQLLAAESILDGTNSTALAGEDESLPVRSRPNEAMGSDDYAPASNWTNRKTTEENGREPTSDAAASTRLRDDQSEQAGNTPRAAERINDDGPQDKDPSINGASGGLGTPSRPAADHAESIDGSDADGASGPVNLAVDTVQPSLITATEFAVDIAGDAIGDVGDIVQSVGGTLAPMVTEVTDLIGDGAGIVGGVLHSTASAIDAVIPAVGPELELAPLVATVEHAVEELSAGIFGESNLGPFAVDIAGDAIGDVGDIVQSVGGTLAPMVTEVTDLIGDGAGIVGGVLHSTASAIDTVISPVGPELELAPLVATVEHAVDELAAGLSDESSGGLLGSGGVITFSDGQSVQLPADDLFVDGRHTDYGLVLRTVATEIISSPTDDVDPGSHAGDHVTPHTAGDGEDAQSDEAAPSVHSAPPMTVELTGVLDDVVIRGSDSLI